MPFHTIETDRLNIILLSPEEIAEVFGSRTRTEAKLFFGFRTDEGYDAEKYKSDHGYTNYRTRLIKFLLVEKSTGITIGTCSLHHWFPAEFRSEMGYHIYQDEHRNKGYMTEAAAAVIAYGFQELRLNRIEAWTAVDNAESMRVLERNYFKNEGVLRQRIFTDGQFKDAFIFALLRDEWKG